MKLLLVCLLLSVSRVALAGPAEDYLAARDRAIAAANRTTAPLSEKQEARARGKLDEQLHRVIPAWRAAGFKQPGKSNLATLFQEMGYGQLDGLVYASENGKTSVIVTTLPLLESWLKGQEHWSPGEADAPLRLDEALRSEDFYTQAISTDAAVASFGGVPVTRPAGDDIASVLLDLRRQDIVPDMPNEMRAAVVRDGRVFVAREPVATPLVDRPRCAEIWRQAGVKADAALAAYRAAGAQDEKAFDAAQKLRDDGDRDHRRCVGATLGEQPSFKVLAAQAQALVDRLQ